VADIAEQVGRLSATPGFNRDLRLRRINRIRSITGTLVIEGNALTEEQVTAILDGKTVLAPPRELQEARNALTAYDKLPEWNGLREADLHAAHKMLMRGLLDRPGVYRGSDVGVMRGNKVIHMAPPANRVPVLMAQLFGRLRDTKEHPLIASSVFHYEFEFIHPFSDGNGRMGRLWQTLLLSRWNPAPGARMAAGGKPRPSATTCVLPSHQRQHQGNGLRPLHPFHAGPHPRHDEQGGYQAVGRIIGRNHRTQTGSQACGADSEPAPSAAGPDAD
jgi:fido (protein-threonine AMPylation protein)